MLSHISSDSLRGNLSFIASKLLEGRDTPSRGLDIAAEYIAAQLRKAGLQPPASSGGYFQTARMLRLAPVADGFELHLLEGSRTLDVAKAQVLVVSEKPLDLAGVPVYKVADPARLTSANVRGRVIALSEPAGQVRAAAKAAAALGPAAFLETAAETGEQPESRLIDAEEATFAGVPQLIVRDPEAVSLLQEAKSGDTGITVSLRLNAPTATPATVSNVAAWLRGSDPVLRHQYVLLTAHYDHIGRTAEGVICPGANDDGSGTVSVIEIAQALAAMRVHPKRSIVFILFFGEEEGDVGSRYYASHPLFPLAQTVADLNLEQVGRTDSDAGPEMSNATLTGFRYTSISSTLEEAGRLTGIKVYDTPDSDDFFERSDNETFAEHGIPAHTIAVAYEFPGYHQPGDVWEKIDFGNMAKVDRMIALGTAMLADSSQAPRWNRADPDTARYLRHRGGVPAPDGVQHPRRGHGAG